jgi:hypothetical protein
MELVGDRIKENEMGRTCNTHIEMYKSYVGNLQGIVYAQLIQ